MRLPAERIPSIPEPVRLVLRNDVARPYVHTPFRSTTRTGCGIDGIRSAGSLTAV